jgi:TolB-like protein/Tfp pilus assembly protein PilF
MAAAAMGIGAVAVSVGWWALAGSDAATARIRSLVVLPLDNLTGAPDQEYFVDGMHDALTAELAKIRALKVISRTSAMQYKGVQQPTPQTASELGVDGVIEGSVAREGDSVRITVQLIHGPTDTHLWTDTYQRELRNVLALQSEVARAIAEQIEVSLAPEEVGRLARAEVVDPAAYEAYLRGQYHWNKLTPAGWKAAIDLLRQSVEQDPTYAPAYAMMSLAYSILGYYSRTPPAILHSRALAAAERAVALDSSLAEAHAGLAFVKFSFDWDWAGADQASQEALRLNPNATMALLSRAFYLSWVGRHDDAIAMLSRAVELDPVAPWANSWLAALFFLARRYDEAIEQANKVLALEPDYPDAHLWLGYSYAKKGMYEEAAKAMIVLEVGWFDAWILALAGRSAEARREAEQIPGALSGTSSNPYFHAVALGELSEKERALNLLEQAYQMRDPLMSVLKIDPRIDALREEPRFQELLRRMNFPN